MVESSNMAGAEGNMDETNSIGSTVDFEPGIRTISSTRSGEVSAWIHNERELIELGKSYKLMVNYHWSDQLQEQTAAEILPKG
jgi:hypothetical protein